MVAAASAAHLNLLLVDGLCFVAHFPVVAFLVRNFVVVVAAAAAVGDADPEKMRSSWICDDCWINY